MNWFFIALSAPFLWALVNISDKYIVTNYSGKDNSPGPLVLFSSLIGIVACISLSIFTSGIFSISLFDKFILVLVGIFSIVWIILYLFALDIEDVSGVVPWMLTIPVFGYILGYVFLGETLTPQQMLGGAIILIGATILSVDTSKINIIFKKKIAILMLLSSIIVALNGVLFKFVASVDNFWVASFWEYFGLGLGGVLIFIFIKKYREDFIKNIKTSGKFIFSMNITSEFTTIAGNLLTSYAILLAPVTLVYMVGSFQPIAVLMLTFLFTKFAPKIIKEDFSLKILLPKLVAIIIMLTGSAILLF